MTTESSPSKSLAKSSYSLLFNRNTTPGLFPTVGYIDLVTKGTTL